MRALFVSLRIIDSMPYRSRSEKRTKLLINVRDRVKAAMSRLGSKTVLFLVEEATRWLQCLSSRIPLVALPQSTAMQHPVSYFLSAVYVRRRQSPRRDNNYTMTRITTTTRK